MYIIINNILLYYRHRRTKKNSKNTTLTLTKAYKSNFRNSNPKNDFNNNENSYLGISNAEKTSGTIKIHILDFK
jgi:hypothetical protein